MIRPDILFFKKIAAAENDYLSFTSLSCILPGRKGPDHCMSTWMFKTLRRAKRFVTGVIGFTVLLIGIAMTVLPGPAILVIPIGLGILATEFVWARSILKRVKGNFRELRNNTKLK